MSIATFVKGWLSCVRSLTGDTRGSVAMMFGLAVDYSRANSTKAHLQGALDSVALMLAKEATSDTADQLQANAAKYFNALFNHPGATDAAITASYTSSLGSQLT